MFLLLFSHSLHILLHHWKKYFQFGGMTILSSVKSILLYRRKKPQHLPREILRLLFLMLLCDEHSSESCHVKHIGSCIGDDIGCISLFACESGAAEDILLHEHCV